MKIRLQIAYDGTNYCGWQIQKNAISVQYLIQKFVREMTGEDNNVVGASRTDAGVHALAQVATFITEKKIPLDGFKMGLNSLLPRDIRIVGAKRVGGDFHPIKDTKGKHYRYIISEARDEHPLYLNRAWPLGKPLDVKEMKTGARHLLGRHDFSAFKAADGDKVDPVKRVKSISIKRQRGFVSERHYIIDVVGDGFLKNMVRNIVGTLAEVGLGKKAQADIKKILESRDRKKAGVCAPASGLYLVKVFYR